MTSSRFFSPLANLRTLIANSATFQSEVGAGDASAALSSVNYYSQGPTAGRPRALVGGRGRSLNKSSSSGWDLRGGLQFEFQRESDSADVDDVDAGFATYFGILETIIDEMAALSGSNGYLDVRAFILENDPLLWREDMNDGEEFWSAVVNVDIMGA